MLVQLQGYFTLNIVDVISVVLQVFVLVCMCVCLVSMCKMCADRFCSWRNLVAYVCHYCLYLLAYIISSTAWMLTVYILHSWLYFATIALLICGVVLVAKKEITSFINVQFKNLYNVAHDSWATNQRSLKYDCSLFCVLSFGCLSKDLFLSTEILPGCCIIHHTSTKSQGCWLFLLYKFMETAILLGALLSNSIQ